MHRITKNSFVKILLSHTIGIDERSVKKKNRSEALKNVLCLNEGDSRSEFKTF